MLTRDQILNVKPTPPKVVDVPEWSGKVGIRCMDGAQRERFERVYSGDRTDIRATLLAATLADEAGRPLFSDSDIAAINRLDAPVLMRLYDLSLAHNRVTEAQIEELEGNS